MAFKLRSPLHIEPKLPVANDGSDKFKNYQAGLKKTYMSSKDSGVGAYPDPQTGERTFYDKKHQSYDMKTGVTNKTGSFKDGKYTMNKPKKATSNKSKSPYPANQGGTPFYNTKTEYVDINKMRADANAEQQKKIDLKNNENNNIVKPVSNAERHDALSKKTGRENINKTSEGVNTKEKVKQLKKKVNNNKGSKSTSTNNTKPIKSSDSDKGTGYFNDKLSFGVDTKINVAPMPKFEKTVTNARSADHNIIGSKPMSKRDRIIRKQNIKTENKRERVGNQIEKIKGRQARKGINIAKKDLKRSDKYVNKGYSSIVDAKQNKPSSSSSSGFQDLSKVGASKPTQTTKPTSNSTKPNSNSTKPTSTSTKPASTSTKGIRPNITVQTPSVIPDSRIKKGAKEAKGGRINEPVSAKTYKSATGLNKLTKKADPSGGMERGMPKSSTSITKPASGPRAKTVKVESGPSKRQKAIMNTYNNIRK